MNPAFDLASRLAQARTLLFVPGNRPERFEKALASGADAVVLDLEDSVSTSEKAGARQAIAQASALIHSATMPVVVRVHGFGSAHNEQDLAWLTAQRAAFGVMLSKAESAAQIQALVAAAPERPVLPLIETAAGYLALAEVAGAPGVVRLVVGHIDFMADTGIRCTDDERELDALRFAVAIQTRHHQLAAPVDGVTVTIDDPERLAADTHRALRFGFGGKLCIHPRQIATVHVALAPAEHELAWARRVIAADEAAQGAAVQLDGRMVDLPVVLQARATLQRARA